jgi:hypothetical protein
MTTAANADAAMIAAGMSGKSQGRGPSLQLDTLLIIDSSATKKGGGGGSPSYPDVPG